MEPVAQERHASGPRRCSANAAEQALSNERPLLETIPGRLPCTNESQPKTGTYTWICLRNRERMERYFPEEDVPIDYIQITLSKTQAL